MKCSKEDIVGFVAALKAFVSKSDEEEVCYVRYGLLNLKIGMRC
jgi:seryl-tRNA(Sec) selenium transferase